MPLSMIYFEGKISIEKKKSFLYKKLKWFFLETGC